MGRVRPLPTFCWAISKTYQPLEMEAKISNPLSAMSDHVKRPPCTVGIYIYDWVEQSLHNRLFIGYYNSVVYQVVSTTIPEGCSMGFVPWFLVL